MTVINPKDPLRKQEVGPNSARELFSVFSQVANGFSREDVVNAAANLLVNSLRQDHATRAKAEAAFDELFGRTKSMLLELHYGPDGRRRSVFPFNQVLEVPHFNSRNKF